MGKTHFRPNIFAENGRPKGHLAPPKKSILNDVFFPKLGISECCQYRIKQLYNYINTAFNFYRTIDLQHYTIMEICNSTMIYLWNPTKMELLYY